MRALAPALAVLVFAAALGCGSNRGRRRSDAGRPDAFVPVDAPALDAPVGEDGGTGSDAPGPPDAPLGACLPDTATGLCWQNPAAGFEMAWDEAGSYCAALGGGYRLPDIDELITFVRGCGATRSGCEVDDPSCLSLSCCDFAGCAEGGGPGDGCYWDPAASGTCDWYHSSSVVDGGPFDAWFIYFQQGSVQYGAQSIPKQVRCVREL